MRRHSLGHVPSPFFRRDSRRFSQISVVVYFPTRPLKSPHYKFLPLRLRELLARSYFYYGIRISASVDSCPAMEQENKEVEIIVYHDGCPGCRVDRRKESNTSKPYKQLIFVWIITLCAALPMSSLFPFLYFMIRDLHVAKRVEDIGFYAGFVGSSALVGRALTSILWGIIADKYGRKPVIVFGIISVIIFNTLFGLSVKYWMAITTRLLLGLCNGLIGVVKAYAVEICRPEHKAFGLSNFSTAWGVGLIVGPAIGGFFAQPAEKYPHLFSKESIFGRFPYFLPCLCISLLTFCASFTCFWLPETIHKHNDRAIAHGTTEALETPNGTDLEQTIGKTEESAPSVSLLKNWPLMSSILVYCVFSLHDMAYSEIFPLWAVSGRKYGGLDFTSQDVGKVLAVSGLSLLVSQLLFYPAVEKRFGPIASARVAAILTIPLLVTYPFMTKLSGHVLFLVITCASILKNILSMTIVTGTFILQNDAVSQCQRGAANGLSMTLQSIFKAVAPAGGGALISWAQKRKSSILPGDHIIFFFLNVVEFVGFILTFKPFLTTN